MADHAGLCLGGTFLIIFTFNAYTAQKDKDKEKILSVKGNASTDSAGIIAAIADQVTKLEPKSPPPVISLQNDSR